VIECLGEDEIDRLPERENVLLSHETFTSRITANITHVSLEARSDGSIRTLGCRTGFEGVKDPN
jgi:hypothetical protein